MRSPRPGRALLHGTRFTGQGPGAGSAVSHSGPGRPGTGHRNPRLPFPSATAPVPTFREQTEAPRGRDPAGPTANVEAGVAPVWRVARLPGPSHPVTRVHICPLCGLSSGRPGRPESLHLQHRPHAITPPGATTCLAITTPSPRCYQTAGHHRVPSHHNVTTPSPHRHHAPGCHHAVTMLSPHRHHAAGLPRAPAMRGAAVHRGPSLARLAVPGGRTPPAVVHTSPQALWTHGLWKAAKGLPDVDCGGRTAAYWGVPQAVASERCAGRAP